MIETVLRSATTEMGSRSGVSMAPLSRKICQDYGTVDFLLMQNSYGAQVML